MKRREFLLTAGAAPIAVITAMNLEVHDFRPGLVKLAPEPILTKMEAKLRADDLVRTLYPGTRFTGFKPNIGYEFDFETATEFAGQFVWMSVITYSDGFKETVYWYVNMTLYGPPTAGLDRMEIFDLVVVELKAAHAYEKMLEMRRKLETEKIMRHWRNNRDWRIKKVVWYEDEKITGKRVPRFRSSPWCGPGKCNGDLICA